MLPHTTYIETHLGSGAVMKKKPPATINIGLDLDAEPISKFECGYAVKLININAHHFLKNYNFTGSELVYVDPPYLPETRTSRSRYTFEYSKKDHINLLKLLKTLPCNVILSGYPSTVYDDTLTKWNTIEFQSMTRGGVRTEKLWFNYKIDKVHWSSFAGKNFTDRQRIKRKAERWSKNYASLPKDERLAIMASIMQVEAES